MIVDNHTFCFNQPFVNKPCDYKICLYTPSMNAEVNSKYAGLYVKFYGDGRFEFLNSLIIKKDVTLNGSPVILCDFGLWEHDQPIAFVNYQDILVIGRPADATGEKLLRLRFCYETLEDGVHHMLKLMSVYDYDNNFNVKYHSYNVNKGYTFNERIYCAMTAQIFTTNAARFHTYITLG